MGPEKDFLIVLTTFPVDGDAESFAKALVDERLAACVNILPAMTSVYTWKGVTERAEERQLIIKTASDHLRDLESRVKQLHPYEVPEFITISMAGGSREYLAWLAEATSK